MPVADRDANGNAARSAGGIPPPIRLPDGVHFENLGDWSVTDGAYSISGTGHIDLSNPNNGIAGFAGHVVIDGMWGHIVQFFGGDIDPTHCPY